MEVMIARERERIKQSSFPENPVIYGKEKSNDNFVPTQEIIEQIPLFLQHFEVEENRNILMQILISLKVPEPYQINAYLFHYIFDETESSTVKTLIIDDVMTFLRSSSSLDSFPYEIFSNEDCIFQLMNFLSSFNIEKRKFAVVFLCSIFDHNQQRKFISPQAYEAIFQIILNNLDPNPCLIVVSILLYPADLPTEVIPLFEPFISTLLTIDLNDTNGIKFAPITLIIISQLVQANIPIDEELILKCKNKFIESKDETIISILLRIMVNKCTPSDEKLDRILELVESLDSPEIANEALHILALHAHNWDDNQRDHIQEFLLQIFHKHDDRDYHCKFVLYAFDVLYQIDRLPPNDIEFFNAILQLIDIGDFSNQMIARGIEAMFTSAIKNFPEIGQQMNELLKKSKEFDSLFQDDDPAVPQVANQIVLLMESLQ